jgi:hypothetical protein
VLVAVPNAEDTEKNGLDEEGGSFQGEGEPYCFPVEPHHPRPQQPPFKGQDGSGDCTDGEKDSAVCSRAAIWSTG